MIYPQWTSVDGGLDVAPDWLAFEITGTPVTLPGGGGGVVTNLDEIRGLGLAQDDEVVLEFIVSFVLSQ